MELAERWWSSWGGDGAHGRVTEVVEGWWSSWGVDGVCRGVMELMENDGARR